MDVAFMVLSCVSCLYSAVEYCVLYTISHEGYNQRLRGRPHLHCLIIACRGKILAIRRPRHRFYAGCMAAIDENAAPTGSIPYVDGGIFTGRGDTPAIGRPGNAVNVRGMTIIGHAMVLG